MSWKLCKTEALRRLALLNLPERVDGLQVTLLEFTNNELTGFLVGGNSFEFQRNVNRALRRELERRGGIVKLKRITEYDTVRWTENGGSQ
jgi:hypothetical protein